MGSSLSGTECPLASHLSSTTADGLEQSEFFAGVSGSYTHGPQCEVSCIKSGQAQTNRNGAFEYDKFAYWIYRGYP